MFIERPPLLFRALFPECIFRLPKRRRKVVYLTFDDGPVPEVTPWILQVLKRYGIRATFFMVGENAKRYPELLARVRREGHSIGNHTMHHLQGAHVKAHQYLMDVKEADALLNTPLFRPPHGWLRWKQAAVLKGKFRIIMYDLVTRDYSYRLTPEDVVNNVKRFARSGSIIVFHDSLKSLPRLKRSLPESIEWLLAQGYEFEPIPEHI